MNKAQTKMLEQLLDKKVKELGLTYLEDIPEGSTIIRWSVGRNEAEKSWDGKPITYKLIRKDRARTKGYMILTYEQDGNVREHESGFMSRDIFKVVS